ncbi:MAG: DUF2179 domain-containing protein [Bacteroidales bacterium]
MDFTSFMDSFWWTWVVLPVLIFCSRILDQSIGTLRVIFVSKGMKKLAPFLGFFEVIIWLLAVAQVMKHLSNPMSYIAYGAGFAMGNYIGILIEEKLSLGTVLVRIVPKRDTTDLINHLRDLGFGVTVIDAEGVMGSKVKIVFTIIKRKNIGRVISAINEFNPNAFYTIEEIKTVKEGYFGIPIQPKGIGIREHLFKRK